MKIEIILFFLLLFGQNGFSCSCIGENSVKEEVKRSNLVITGRILSRKEISLSPDQNNSPKTEKTHVAFQVLVNTKFKGSFQSDTVTIITGFGGGDCGFEFEIGQNYVIYASQNLFIGYGKYTQIPNTFETDICTRTKIEDEAELAALKKIRKPEKG